MTSRYTEPLRFRHEYDRKALADLWGLRGYQALGRGVFTPAKSDLIFLFVTRERAHWMTQYNNFLSQDLLFWDGEKGHGSDNRIINASHNGEEIHLFYRDHRRLPFTYYGKLLLLKCHKFTDRPSSFIFLITELSETIGSPEPEQLREDAADYEVISKATLNAIDKSIATKSRGVAQRLFRGNLMRLWQGSCAVTSVQEPRVLRSSHIKPWAESNSQEKVDHFNGLLLVPNLDALFNDGLISFRNDGQILISQNWRADDKRLMHVTPDLRLRTVHRQSIDYLEYHRDVIFSKEEHPHLYHH